MDELQIFAQPLDEGRSDNCIWTPRPCCACLPLDKAPGVTAFEDLSRSHVATSCNGSTCPTFGDGRPDRPGGPVQPAMSRSRMCHHTGARRRQCVGSVLHRRGLDQADRVTGVQSIVSTARHDSDNGWSFRLSGGDLAFEPYGYGTSSTSLLGFAGPALVVHVAAVVDATTTSPSTSTAPGGG